MDDSRSREQSARMRGVLGTFASKGATVLYAGMEEKASFAQVLVQAGSPEGLPADVVEFCLFGDEGNWPTCGTNRNALLLATAGELFVMADDDTAYQSIASVEHDNNLALTSLNDLTDIRYFDDRAELSAAVHAADVGILSCHEKLLGRSVPGCLSGIGPDCTLEAVEIGPELAYRLRRTPAAVRATMSGYWGDSGMGSPNAAFELLGESRELAMRSKADYVRAKTSREVFRSVPRYTISGGSLFMTMSAGFDNRTLLPPFIPVGRGEDGLFSLTMQACVDGSLIGHLPLAVSHAPDELRRFPPGAFLDPTPRLAETVAAAMSSFTPAPGPRSVSSRLAAMGRHLMDLSSLSTSDFEDQLRTSWLSAAGRYIGFLEHLLDLYHGQPDYWAKDVLSFIEIFGDFVVNGSPAVPLELREGPVEQARESCRRLVGKFGELLYWWPVIDGAAKRLRDAGTQLVRRL
jgi:hypothetical protein